MKIDDSLIITETQTSFSVSTEAMSELIVDGKATSLSLDPFDPKRFR